MAAFNKFNCFVQDVANALHDMKTGTAQVYKVYLTNALPTATNTFYNVPADLPAGNGYLSGGASIGAVAGSQTSGTFRFFGSTNPAWTAAGGSIGPFQYAVLYNSTSATKPLIGWWDYGTGLVLTNGNTFTVALDQINGILTIS
ncbi:hypothetical protein QA639_29995 [Bradyrhizobium pachyrhizi]|uniref:hypothetical protein n=1 Tax=Bradyrhizobium pachyrhizi TaxID=280333 RepID=UPI0024B21A36|nr:hypothetical protein [Bradyrhizobium pachyrhizi]WFU53866.1 hypothetical protein QA639_29995 [Bradyrhizobium pachyrhizi]